MLIAWGPRRRIPYAVLISIGFVVGMSTAASAQSVDIDPPSQQPGGSVTFSGSGWQPGETVTVQFGGSTIATATADDAGSWQASGTIPADMPAGQHPMDFNGDQGSVFDTDYEVTAPPGADQPGPEEDDGAPGGDEGEPQGETADETPRAQADPAGAKDGGIPAWLWILGLIAVLLALIGGWTVARRRGESGTFVDAAGRQWQYCEARACRVEKQTVTDTDGRRVLARCVPLPGKCQGCECVLFIERGNNPPERADLNEDGWYVLQPGETPSCRCIK